MFEFTLVKSTTTKEEEEEEKKGSENSETSTLKNKFNIETRISILKIKIQH